MNLNSEKGFSLFEVLVAISVFAIFFVVFSSSFFHNKNASMELNEELAMANIAEKTLKEILLSPPTLTESLHKSEKKENFEDAAFKDYQYIVEWSRLEIPNFSELTRLSGDNKDQNAQSSIVAKVFKHVQEATKDSIWQLRLTIIHTPTEKKYPVALWFKNPNKEISLSGIDPTQSPSKSQDESGAE